MNSKSNNTTPSPVGEGRGGVLTLLPVLLAFFAMGFVDLVGTASNFLKADLNLSDAEANFFPSLVFFWFLLFSVPTGMLMNKIGRKKTVLLSLIVTAVSLALPIVGNDYYLMLVAFSLLGIGNALMQTSLNPLMSLLVNPDKLASNLTFGQFIKAIASFLAPIICAWGASQSIVTFGLSWRILFPIYMVVGVIAILWLGATEIEENPTPALPTGGGSSKDTSVLSQFAECFKLLIPRKCNSKSPSPCGEGWGGVVLLSFLGIMCHVGIDVGTNTTAPKLLQEVGLPLEEAAFATSLYFIFRTIGCFTGSIILQRIALKNFFIISVVMMAAAMACMFVGGSAMMLYIGIALVGYGNSNIFSMCFSQALNAMPEKQNEVSGLMIMGLFGGTVFPLAMGLASDAIGQAGAVAVMTIGVAYLLIYYFNIKK